ncbi:MAG TPA: BREX system P-loop protein BrxC, partial [Anaerolineae bacterium]|nr:BREX system P-loop protein BrxC [Anaerolineae bacterium]
MAQLATIFAKPINRHIEGVIKADDNASLRQEVEEYVLTNEVARQLDIFLSAYNDYQGANGVWISGFFGSGKSHLLKMLALLLENREVDGEPALDLFLPKCGDNEILRGDLKRAAAIPSRSILFNIDQKADVISKKEVDAVLAVFVKVFDEMSGYYGKQAYIAQFERDLDGRGQYTAFQEAFAQIAGISWSRGREQALLEGGHIAAAYAEVAGMPESEAKGILDKYRQDYKLSIEDFAEQVNEYIARQEPNFRLNFFVDEVGQYIADNVKLMTNLQTIAESLATKCLGRAWIIVTAQEDMRRVVGEMGKRQGDDFSKIQARFANRLKLTSADVAEVIQKRLLLKNEMGIQLLSAVYAARHNNFKTLFDFADGGQTYRNFRDREHFIHSYPFIPYQFPLFQASIQNLSEHNAFEGRHSSVGERSMLGVFQQVAMAIADQDVGNLATFDLMFEGIRTSLKANIQRAVTVAEKNLDNKFAVQVLKALLLVKYVREFRATVRNLTVLMLPRLDADVSLLKRRLEEALNLLEQQTYIQRNGDLYEYLTDEEKDVEVEIKATEVETSAVAEELGRLIFDNVIKDRKIRYDENGQDYPFSRKLDDHILGREYELAIHVVTPFHDQFDNETVLRAQALGRDELLVILPPSDRLVRDLRLYKQTDKYVQQNISLTQQDSVKRILDSKLRQNQKRAQALSQMVRELLVEAPLIVGGQDLEIHSADAKTRLVQGFHQLIERAYPHLRMLRGVAYRQEDLPRYLRPETTLLGDAPATFSEAEQEMFNFVNGNRRNGLRTTLHTLRQHFERKPYGWYLAAIQGILAKLCARGKIELRQDGVLLEDADLERAILNTHGYSNVVLSPQIEFTAAQVRGLRDFYADFFDRPPHANEAKPLGQETAVAFRELADKLTGLRAQAAQYPFLTALDEPITAVQSAAGQSYTFYLTELREQEDTLLDLKEGTIDPILRFMNGAQREIYDAARTFLRAQKANFSYVGEAEARQLQRILDDPHCYRGNKMQAAKTLLDGLQEAVAQRVAQEKAETLAGVDERQQRLTGMAEFAELDAARQAELERPFTDLRQRIAGQTLIAVIKDTLRLFDETTYPRLLQQMVNWAAPPDEAPEVLK